MLDPGSIGPATLIVGLAEAWLCTGAAVALCFLFFRLDRLDPGAHDAYAFRFVILPGLMLLWPLVVWRWLRPGSDLVPRPPGSRRRHARAWAVLAVILPAILLTGLLLRQNPLPDPPGRRIEIPPAGGRG